MTSLAFKRFLMHCYRLFFVSEEAQKNFQNVSAENLVYQIPLKGVNYQTEVERIDNEVGVAQNKQDEQQ